MGYFRNTFNKCGQYFNYYKHSHKPAFFSELTAIDFVCIENTCDCLCSECEQMWNCMIFDDTGDDSVIPM